MLGYAILTAVCAFTYAYILTDAGMILERPANFLNERLPIWLSKPLMLCSKCVSGWWALISYFFLSEGYNPFAHVAFVLGVIFITSLIERVYE